MQHSLSDGQQLHFSEKFKGLIGDVSDLIYTLEKDPDRFKAMYHANVSVINLWCVGCFFP